jgi:hypothetical protein
MKKIFLHQRFGHSLFIAGSFTLLICLVTLSPLSSGRTMAFGVSDIVDLTNQTRQQMSLQPYSINTALMNAAQMKAEDMAKERYFAHTAPDGTTGWDYIKKVSYSYTVAGENLAITNENAESVLNAWLNSPEHRDNLLSSVFTDFGIGMAAYGDYDGHQNTYVIVAFYAEPASVQSLTAATYPAGTVTPLKSFYTDIPPPLVISIAVILILAGGTIEFRHIKHLHHAPQLT